MEVDKNVVYGILFLSTSQLFMKPTVLEILFTYLYVL